MPERRAEGRVPVGASLDQADRIEEIHPATCRFDLDEPLDIGGRRITSREYTVARVTTESGITGCAYASG